jgi:hypothetical protein
MNYQSPTKKGLLGRAPGDSADSYVSPQQQRRRELESQAIARRLTMSGPTADPSMQPASTNPGPMPMAPAMVGLAMRSTSSTRNAAGSLGGDKGSSSSSGASGGVSPNDPVKKGKSSDSKAAQASRERRRRGGGLSILSTSIYDRLLEKPGIDMENASMWRQSRQGIRDMGLKVSVGKDGEISVDERKIGGREALGQWQLAEIAARNNAVDRGWGPGGVQDGAGAQQAQNEMQKAAIRSFLDTRFATRQNINAWRNRLDLARKRAPWEMEQAGAHKVGTDGDMNATQQGGKKRKRKRGDK